MANKVNVSTDTNKIIITPQSDNQVSTTTTVTPVTVTQTTTGVVNVISQGPQGPKAFPHTGSAGLTGSLIVTGSIDVLGNITGDIIANSLSLGTGEAAPKGALQIITDEPTDENNPDIILSLDENGAFVGAETGRIIFAVESTDFNTIASGSTSAIYSKIIETSKSGSYGSLVFEVNDKNKLTEPWPILEMGYGLGYYSFEPGAILSGSLIVSSRVPTFQLRSTDNNQEVAILGLSNDDISGYDVFNRGRLILNYDEVTKVSLNRHPDDSNYFSGSVGIGIDNPKSKLHVVGNISATTYTGDGSLLTNINTGSWDGVYTGSAEISGGLKVIGEGNSEFSVGKYTFGYDTVDFLPVIGSGIIVDSPNLPPNHYNMVKIGNVELLDINTIPNPNTFYIHNVDSIIVASGSEPVDISDNIPGGGKLFEHDSTEFKVYSNGLLKLNIKSGSTDIATDFTSVRKLSLKSTLTTDIENIAVWSANPANSPLELRYTPASTFILSDSPSQTITGDLTVGGKLTAQEFHTEIVSSSIIYESGSTKFGDSADDTHEITGSVLVEGTVSASTYYGDGSNLEGIEGFPYTGSAEISGSLEVIGDIISSGNVLFDIPGGDGGIRIGNDWGGYQTINWRSNNVGFTLGAGGSLIARVGATGPGGFIIGNITNNQGTSATLDVRGDTIITGTNNLAGNYALKVADSNNNSILAVQNDGKVGIGTIDPFDDLHIQPTSPNQGLSITEHDTPTRYGLRAYAHNAGGVLAVYSAGNPNIVLSGWGNIQSYLNVPTLGIGTTSASERLTVEGNISASGYVSASTYYGDGSNLEGIEGFPYTGSAEISGSLTVIGSSTLGSTTLTSINGVDVEVISKDINFTSSINIAQLTSSIESAMIDYRLTSLNNGSRIGTFMYSHDGTDLSYNDLSVPGSGTGGLPILSASLAGSLVNLDIENAAGFNFTGFVRKFDKLNFPVPVANPNLPTPLLDAYGGAAAAYSLRKLSVAYTGSAVRVREDGGNTEADIGFDVNGGFDISALNAHCGANNGFVITWYDQSGNGNDATQTTTGNQPKIYDNSTGVVTENGKPAIEFAGNTVFNEATIAGNNTSDFFTVFQTSDARHNLNANNGDVSMIAQSGLEIPAFTNFGTPAYRVNGAPVSIATRNDAYNATSIGSQILLNSSGDASNWTTYNIIYRSDPTDSFNLVGTIQEILYYNTTIDPTIREGIESNINSHYNIYQTGLLAEYPGATAAYSLRQLTTGYTGSAVRVREDGTNSETDIGFDSDGNLDILALAEHCAGNNGFVTTWYDQSGNTGRDAEQTTTGNQAKIYDSSTGVVTRNSLPALSFDDTSFYPIAVNNPSPWTMASVHYFEGSSQYIYGANLKPSMYYSGNTPRIFADTAYTGNTKAFAQYLRVDRYSSATGIANINYNGSQDAGFTGVGAYSAASLGSIGSHANNSLQASWDNDMQELIFWPTYQSDENLDGIETNINDYYNIYTP